MIQRSEEIKDLCESYLILGMDILDGYHCDSIDCKFCPFSDDNNNGTLCRHDSKEHYNEIAKKYLREYESDDDSICFEEEDEDTVETLHHVGDKVKIREDLEIDECYEGCDFVDDMEDFKGKIVTISKAYVDEYDGEDNYHIKEDDGKYGDKSSGLVNYDEPRNNGNKQGGNNGGNQGGFWQGGGNNYGR